MMDDLEQKLDEELKSYSEKLRKLNVTTATEDEPSTIESTFSVIKWN